MILNWALKIMKTCMMIIKFSAGLFREEVEEFESLSFSNHFTTTGLDAPRNSLELPVETFCVFIFGFLRIVFHWFAICIQYANTKESSSKDYYSMEAPMKKLISEEISKRPNTRQNAPSVVARLMGVDALPFDSKPSPQLVQTKNDTLSSKLMGKEQSKKDFVGSFGHSIDRHGDQRMKWNKPKPREHPQEEELQKFKKEFEAWQAARFKECSNVVEFTSDPTQLIAQEELNREKMLLYSNSKRSKSSERLRETKDLSELAKKHLAYSVEEKESLYSSGISRTKIRASQLMNSDQQLDIVSAPTKIVILRPGPDRMDINEDSWNSSTPSTSEERGRIEDFLEEVKERLKSELQGKSSKWSTTVRGGGIETPYREKPSEPREIAQRIAQQVRESVGMNLLRSESTRSCRSEIQLNGTGSPEFINRDTRKLLAERLKNVLKGEETHQQVPMLDRNRSRLSLSDYDKGRPGQSRNLWIENKMSDPDNFTNEIEKSRSFRQEQSPRNLIRSLSAPVSGASFGKLLLEDRNILTGAQIRRKHEVIEKVSMNIKKHKKDKFNIREKVSSFRYSLTLRGRLFRRRVKSVVESVQNKNHLLKDITSGPTVAMSFYETHENSTEVPPSPASVCSSIQEEFWRQADYLSPMSSSSGVHQLEDSEVPNVFREINSNLNELRRKLNQLEGSVPEETINEQQPTELEVEIEDQAEAYIRDLLIAAGLYDGSYSQSLSKWDPLGKPISNQVFEEVEEAYKQRTKDDERSKNDQGEKVNHMMILDLLNEVLPSLLRQPVNISRYMEKAIGPLHKPPHGRKLLSHVWNTVRASIHSPEDKSYYSLDHMLARDLETKPWSKMMNDDINAVGREIECLIIGELIEETVKYI
ncbi:hypothetical protein BUALT_Bualt11G0040300 [Buddleja alternifolia]|uniref:DUF4378 domain-containing protein n=1 Tax=Buddleja alternifolia TaxID=168488 RepID=A0AAV6WZN1_9LAMI|nr:hypothetical protein BUALT_Bualt11G0040300 [Buddleja alternifolia]